MGVRQQKAGLALKSHIPSRATQVKDAILICQKIRQDLAVLLHLVLDVYLLLSVT